MPPKFIKTHKRKDRIGTRPYNLYYVYANLTCMLIDFVSLIHSGLLKSITLDSAV